MGFMRCGQLQDNNFFMTATNALSYENICCKVQ